MKNDIISDGRKKDKISALKISEFRAVTVEKIVHMEGAYLSLRS